ncbi:MAG: hypothetical protein AAAB17_00885, partial [Pseudomonas sp.]
VLKSAFAGKPGSYEKRFIHLTDWHQAKAPFIEVNGAFVCKKECFSTTHGIMRAVMMTFERTRRATC